MLAFIDESGNPHPNDASSRPVIAAVCFDEKDSRAKHYYRTLRVVLLVVLVQHILHPRHELPAHLGDTPLPSSSTA